MIKRCPSGTQRIGNRCFIKGRNTQIKVPEGFAQDGDFDFKYINGKKYRIMVRLEIQEE